MISIVIPTYNRAVLIKEALDSVLAQKGRDWECVVVDDGSTDNTKKVVKEYAALDNRIVYVGNTRSKGAQGARNSGVLASRGDWVCFFDSDDIMYSEYIEKMQMAISKEEADVFICYANIRNTRTGEIIGCLDNVNIDELPKELLTEKSYVAYDVCVIRKQKILDIGLLDENCPSMQEWDTHIRLSRRCRYHLISETLCEWRVGGNDTITNDNKKHLAGRLYIFGKHCRTFRRYAYRHYLNVLMGLWGETDRKNSILKMAPELLFYIPVKKLLQK